MSERTVIELTIPRCKRDNGYCPLKPYLTQGCSPLCPYYEPDKKEEPKK